MRPVIPHDQRLILEPAELANGKCQVGISSRSLWHAVRQREGRRGRQRWLGFSAPPKSPGSLATAATEICTVRHWSPGRPHARPCGFRFDEACHRYSVGHLRRDECQWASPSPPPRPRPRAGAARPSPTPEAAPRRPSRGGARARGLSGGAQDNGKMRSLLYCRPWPSRRPVRSARSHAARSLTLERPGSDPVGEGGAVEAG